MKEKLNFLDGLKGIACLCVAINHFINVFCSRTVVQDNEKALFAYNLINNNPVLRLLHNGNFYVMLFLLISAFLTSYLLINKKDMLYYKTTIFKRALRIILPVFAVCLITYIISKINGFENINKLQEITLSITKDVKCFNNISLIKVFTIPITCLFKITTDFNMVFWMLPVLYKGFFISVILSFLVEKLKPKKAVIILIIATIIVRMLIDNTLVLFPIGTLIAYLYIAIKNNTIKISYNRTISIVTKIISIILLIIGLYLGSVPYNNNFDGYYSVLKQIPNLSYTTAHIIGAILVLSSVMCLENVKKILNMKPLVKLGRFSFSIYLLHFPLQCSLGAWIFIQAYELTLSYIKALFVTIPIYFTLLLIFSFLFQKFIAEKTEKLNKKIVSKIITD